MSDLIAKTAIDRRLAEIVRPVIEDLGFELVRVRMMQSEAGDGAQALQVMAEDPATGQLVIEQCAELSRRVSAVIDSCEEAGEVLIEGAYHLEVSSPGIDRPLTRRADFADWAGHEARIKFVEPVDAAKQVSGIVDGIDGDTVRITTPKGERTVDFANIASAKLLLTDKLIHATAPLSTDGADNIEVDPSEDEAAETLSKEG